MMGARWHMIEYHLQLCFICRFLTTHFLGSLSLSTLSPLTWIRWVSLSQTAEHGCSFLPPVFLCVQLLRNTDNCPTYDQLRQEDMQAPWYKKVEQDNQVCSILSHCCCLYLTLSLCLVGLSVCLSVYLSICLFRISLPSWQRWQAWKLISAIFGKSRTLWLSR